MVSVVKMTYTKILVVIASLVLSVVCSHAGEIIAINQTRPEGCRECAYYRCPESPAKCLLGAVPDTCDCCPTGRCAKLDGEACWNSSIVRLPIESKNEGLCARNYLCQLRNDLLNEDTPEAICVCMEQSPACGNNNRTYSTPCALHEEAMRQKNANLKLKHLGPCPSRPWLLPSSLENVSATFGQRVALNCEAKGFPVPDIFWEFHSVHGRVLKLPSDEHEGTVHTSDGPEPFMRTSWLQLARITREHAGIYQCITNNTIGEASKASIITIV